MGGVRWALRILRRSASATRAKTPRAPSEIAARGPACLLSRRLAGRVGGDAAIAVGVAVDAKSGPAGVPGVPGVPDVPALAGVPGDVTVEGAGGSELSPAEPLVS